MLDFRADILRVLSTDGLWTNVEGRQMREVIANSMLHRELESAGWITFKVENNIAYVYNPHEYVHKMREAGL